MVGFNSQGQFEKGNSKIRGGRKSARKTGLIVLALLSFNLSFACSAIAQDDKAVPPDTSSSTPAPVPADSPGSSTANPASNPAANSDPAAPQSPTPAASQGEGSPPNAAPASNAQPVNAQPTSQVKPKSSGRPHIGLQFMDHRLLARYLRCSEAAALARIKHTEATCRNRLARGGFDPNIDLDTAIDTSAVVVSLYMRQSIGNNIMTRGFKVEGSLVQYAKRPSGKVDTVRFQRIGETPEIYSSADFEYKCVQLVDVFMIGRQHMLNQAAKAKKGAKGKPAVKGRGAK